jgi:hypothetical protein
LTAILASSPLCFLAADGPDPRALGQLRDALAKVGVAMHRYHSEQGGKFPPSAIRGKSGQPLLSWRVALLPLLGEDALYREFRLDEPWDSPRNKPLIARMPAVYAPFGPGAVPPGCTYFQAIVGPGTLFEHPTGHSYRAIPDGGAATLLVVEGDQAVPWTQPLDLLYDPKGPLPHLGGHFRDDGSLALFADGSVAFLKRNLDEPTLRALMTRDGAEVLPRITLRDHIIPIRRR